MIIIINNVKQSEEEAGQRKKMKTKTMGQKKNTRHLNTETTFSHQVLCLLPELNQFFFSQWPGYFPASGVKPVLIILLRVLSGHPSTLMMLLIMVESVERPEGPLHAQFASHSHFLSFFYLIF